jgi:hypothetical protein
MGGGGTEWDQKRPTVLTQICSDVDIGEKKKMEKGTSQRRGCAGTGGAWKVGVWLGVWIPYPGYRI